MTAGEREQLQLVIISIGGGFIAAMGIIVVVCYGSEIDGLLHLVFQWAMGAGLALVGFYFLFLFIMVFYVIKPRDIREH